MPKLKLIHGIIALVVIGAAVYFLFFYKKGDKPAVSGGATGKDASGKAGESKYGPGDALRASQGVGV